jgi:hypothetical protein
VNMAMNLWVPYRKQDFFDKLSDSFSNSILHHGVSK